MIRTGLLCAGLALLPARGADQSGPAGAPPAYERVRAACIEGRRSVCGRVLQVTKAGLVVDSGYAELLKPPFNHSWLTRSGATPVKTPNLVEGAAPDSVAVGLVFLTDIPKRQTVHQFDYVALVGYPAGGYEYVPAPGVKKQIRRFAAGLERAVKLTLEASEH